MFQVGDKIAHPMHGAGVIERIEKRKISGELREYYFLRIPRGNMVIMIPVHTCDSIGVRPILGCEQARDLIASLRQIQIAMTANWNQRYRENFLRIKSGNLLEVAGVIKGLLQRERLKSLSNGERKMLHTAKQILISELMLSQDLPYEEVEGMVFAALAE